MINAIVFLQKVNGKKHHKALNILISIHLLGAKMKILSILLAMLISTHSYACAFKDYECMKQKQIQSHAPTQKYDNNPQRTYRYNEKIYISGTHDNSALQITDTYNHNIYVHAHNTNIRSDSGTGALVDIDSASTHNNIKLNVSGVATTNVRNMTSLETCVSLVCNRGSNNSGIKIKVDNAMINTTVR